jgi:hypothetical protein
MYVWMDVRLDGDLTVRRVLFIFSVKEFGHPRSMQGKSETPAPKIFSLNMCSKTQNVSSLENVSNKSD